MEEGQARGGLTWVSCRGDSATAGPEGQWAGVEGRLGGKEGSLGEGQTRGGGKGGMSIYDGSEVEAICKGPTRKGAEGCDVGKGGGERVPMRRGPRAVGSSRGR